MYPPSHFTESRPEILLQVMRENSFATVVTAAGGVPFVSHVPVLIDDGGAAGAIRIRGHVSRANPQGKQLEASEQVLAIFHGPHGYVSPSWYEARGTSRPGTTSPSTRTGARGCSMGPSWACS